MKNKEKRSKVFKVLKDKFVLAPFKYLSVFVAGVVFASGLVYAWNAVWHGTDWIQPGVVVRSEPLAESLQYLYEKTIKKDELQDCFGRYKKLEIKNKNFVCSDYTPKGCKLRYKIFGNFTESDYGYTDWGTANKGDWVYGNIVYAKSHGNKTKYRIDIMCDEGQSYELGYRFRGNLPHAPSWSTVGTLSADGKVKSKVNNWGIGTLARPTNYSCSLKGGDGGCGMLVKDINESGPLNCDVAIRYANTPYPGGTGGWDYSHAPANGGYGSSLADPPFHTQMQMAIRCNKIK